MKKNFTLLCLFLLIITPFIVFSQTEIYYLDDFQFLQEENISQEGGLPLFMTYLFRLLLAISIFVSLGVAIYGGFLYITSGGSPVKRKYSRSWILSALQGFLIVLASYALLFTIDSRLVVFDTRDLSEIEEKKQAELDWRIENTYFQVPFGLLVEDAILNEKAKKNFYSILEPAIKVKNTAEKIAEESKKLLLIVESCVEEDSSEEEEASSFFFTEGSIPFFPVVLATVKPQPVPDPPLSDSRPFSEWRGDGNRPPFRLGQIISSVEKNGIRESGCFPVADTEKTRYTEMFGWTTNRGNYPDGTLIPDRWHVGVDIAADEGTSVYASHGGEVLYAEDAGTMGRTVAIHYIGPGERNYVNLYAHLYTIASSISPGKKVYAGEEIGTVGMTGVGVGYNHLHYETMLIPNENGKNDSLLDNFRNVGSPMSRWRHAIDSVATGFLPETLEEANYCDFLRKIYSTIPEKIREEEEYMSQLLAHVEEMGETKKITEEDLFQLYKAIIFQNMVSSESYLPYTSFLLERRYFEKEEVAIETYDDWKDWLGNTLYEVEVDGQIIKENDPLSFYTKKYGTERAIDDALFLAQKAREGGMHTVEKDFEETSSFLLLKRISSFFKELAERFHLKEASAEDAIKKLEKCLAEKEITLEEAINLPLPLYNALIKDCGIDSEGEKNILDVYVKSPSDYLNCGMEIPVGEVFDLTWDHLVDLTNSIEGYIEKSKELVKQQAAMNALAAPCDCHCKENGENCPPCDLEGIKDAHREVLLTRDKMREIIAHIELLTDGHFNTLSEDVCHRLNEDIRDEKEKELCRRGGNKLITKHELVTRKLNYSRYSFDQCATRPEHLEDVLEGKNMGKVLLFGFLVEKKDLPRYTKTKKDGFVVNTSDFNWFCCSDSRSDD